MTNMNSMGYCSFVNQNAPILGTKNPSELAGSTGVWIDQDGRLDRPKQYATKTALATALDYASQGWPVFPCDPTTKRPQTKSGFKDATTDVQQINAWWGKHPQAMIGMPTGEASGLWVLDIDLDTSKGINGQVGIEALGVLPKTFAVSTPRGGLHCMFKWNPVRPVKSTAGSICEGVDTRGQGGYVILPGSTRADGARYEWLVSPDQCEIAEAPAWLMALATRPSSEKPSRKTEEPKPMGLGLKMSNENYGQAALDDECEIVARAPEGKRNHTLNKSAHSLGQLIAGGEIDEEDVRERLMSAAQSCGLVQSDGMDQTLKTIESGISAGIKKPRHAPPRPEQHGQDLQRAEPKISGKVTEDAAAKAFTERYGPTLKYCHTAGTWYLWNSTIWKPEKKSLAFHLARELVRESATGTDQSKASFAGAVERFAKADPVHARSADDWDQYPFILGTPKGLVNLQTGCLGISDPHMGVTKATAVGPSDAASCPLWLSFLDDATGGDADMIRFIKQWSGYCLTGDTREHALVFVFGGGGNGKSVWLNTLIGIMGDYAATAAMDSFTASPGDKHSTDLAMLRGARLVTASETEEGKSWAEARIKQMTGGDPITARFMRQDNFTFKPAFKLTIIGNHKPILKNPDEAMARRFNLLPFIHKPQTPDRQLEEKLKAEWPAILRWMIEGCLDWQENGLQRPESVLAATRDYFADQDLLRQWLEDSCRVERSNRHLFAGTSELFESWSNYAEQANERAGTSKAFAERLKQKGFESKRTMHARGFTGIEVKSVLTYRSEASEHDGS
jgi:putative DNA primase/helicase